MKLNFLADFVRGIGNKAYLCSMLTLTSLHLRLCAIAMALAMSLAAIASKRPYKLDALSRLITNAHPSITWLDKADRYAIYRSEHRDGAHNIKRLLSMGMTRKVGAAREIITIPKSSSSISKITLSVLLLNLIKAKMSFKCSLITKIH